MLIYGKVDIGVNYYGWSEDDVYNFISSYGFNDKSVATQMYSQMLSEPANYCKYVLGYVGFMELKAAATGFLYIEDDITGYYNYRKAKNAFLLNLGLSYTNKNKTMIVSIKAEEAYSR